MSSATKRKHVEREVLDECQLPDENRMIVQIESSKGNNLHQVIDERGTVFLVSMPTKFRKNIWIKRGDFVLVCPIEEGDKVKAEIVTILYKDNIKFIKKNNLWPKAFAQADTEEDDVIDRCGPRLVDGHGIDEHLLPPSHSEDDSDDQQ